MKLFSLWSGYEGIFAITEAEDLMEASQNLANRGRTDWDKCFSAYTLSRICSKDKDGLERAKHMPSALANKMIGIDQATYRAFVVKYEAFKAANGLIDFTDMLAYALTEMHPLDDVKYAVVDECLPAGTRITMADGTTKLIEQVEVGDQVLGVGHPNDLKPKVTVVVEKRTRMTDVLVTINGSLSLTPNHPVYVVGEGYVASEKLKSKDPLVFWGKTNAQIEDSEVRSIEWVRVKQSIPVYNIGTGTENYFAEGILVHNCQDLAPILYSITDRLFQGAQELWLAGDEDQAIFNFAASDAKLFIDRAKSADARVYLRQTHRFGNQIVDFSGKIIRRVHERVKKEVLGYEGREHNIKTIGEFQPMVGSSMLLLHRHVMGCQALAAAYIAAGKPFRNERGKDPLGSYARVKGYQALKDLADGKSVSMASVERLVDDLMPSMVVDRNGEKKRLVVHGGKKKVSEGKIKGDANIMDLLQAKVLTVDGAEVIRQKHFRALKYPDDLEYYDRVVENGYSLEQACPIITTIHGSKGRQADQVVLFAEMGKKCWDDPDTEHRLAYVGATRTRGDLTICQDRTVDWAEEYYDYPEVKKDVTQKDTGVR